MEALRTRLQAALELQTALEAPGLPRDLEQPEQQEQLMALLAQLQSLSSSEGSGDDE